MKHILFNDKAAFASAGVSLDYSRGWETADKETGEVILANTPAYEPARSLVSPCNWSSVGTFTGGTGDIVPATVKLATGTWLNNAGAMAFLGNSSNTSVGIVAIDTEDSAPITAASWSLAALNARIAGGIANRTVAISYKAGDALLNSRTDQINILRNAGASQGETSTERHVPIMIRITNGIPVAFCRVFTGTGAGTEVANSICVWGENLSETGFYASAVTAAKANTVNRWFLAHRFENHNATGFSPAAGNLNCVTEWFPFSPDEMWLASIDYRAAASTMGGFVAIAQTIRQPNGLWQLNAFDTVYAERAGLSYSTHFQGVVLMQDQAGGLNIYLSRQQVHKNGVLIRRPDRNNYLQGRTPVLFTAPSGASANWPEWPITGGTTTTLTFAADDPNISIGDTILIRGSGGSVTATCNNTRVLTNKVVSGGPVTTLTWASALPTAVTAAGAVSRNTPQFNRNGWYVNQIYHGVPGDLAIAVGLTAPQQHGGYLSGCALDTESRSVICGSDNGGAIAIRIDCAADPTTTRSRYQMIRSNYNRLFGLAWGCYKSTTGWVIPFTPSAPVSFSESRMFISNNGFDWGTLCTSTDTVAVCGRKTYTRSKDALLYSPTPTVRRITGLLTSWSGPNYLFNVAQSAAGADANVIRVLNLSNVSATDFAASLAADGAPGYTIPRPPTLGPVHRFATPKTPAPQGDAAAGWYAGDVRLTGNQANLALPAGRFKVKSYAYMVPAPLSVIANLQDNPFHTSSNELYMRAQGASAGFEQAGWTAIPFFTNCDGEAWMPNLTDFSTVAADWDATRGFPAIWNGTTAPGQLLINPRVGNAVGVFGDSLFTVQCIVAANTSGFVDYPSLPLPVATGNATATAAAMDVRVRGFNPSGTYLFVAAGVLPYDAWDYTHRENLRPPNRRLCTFLDPTTGREIAVSYGMLSRSFVFTDGTNTTVVRSPIETTTSVGYPFTNATANAAGLTLTGGGIPNSSTENLVGRSVFVTGGTGTGNSPPSVSRTAVITAHSGTTITLDKSVAPGSGTNINGVVCVGPHDFQAMQGVDSIHIAVYRNAAAGSYIFAAAAAGAMNAVSATWTGDGADIRPTEVVLAQGNPDALAWGFVSCQENATAGLSTTDIFSALNRGDFIGPLSNVSRYVPSIKEPGWTVR